MLAEPSGRMSSPWDVVRLLGCLYSLRGHGPGDPQPVCPQSLLPSSHAGATILLHSVPLFPPFLFPVSFILSFPSVFGASTLAAFFKLIQFGMLESGDRPVPIRFPSGSPLAPVRLSSGNPAAPVTPPFLLPFLSPLSLSPSVAVCPSLHLFRSLSFSFPCFLKRNSE